MTTPRRLVLVLLLIQSSAIAHAATVTFSWDQVTTHVDGTPVTNLAGYKLYYSKTSGSVFDGVDALEGPSPVPVPITALANPAAPTFSLHNLPSCTHYWFAVSAFDANNNESGLSTILDETIVAKPDQVQVSPGPGEGKLTISWSGLPAGDTGSIAGYKIYYDIDAGEPYAGTGAAQGPSPFTLPATSTSVTLQGLSVGTTYYVLVEALCPDGKSSKSVEGSGVVATQACGNGVTEAGETCDPVASCPTTCNDGNACTIDALTGSAATCNSVCGYTPITNCVHGDGCCPPSCNNNNDNDCSVTCGNGELEQGETCDPSANCPKSCEDGNSCTIDTLAGSAANCNVTCSHGPVTACAGGDGCCPTACNNTTDSDCSATCGNAVIEAGETCDPAASCPASCSDGNACTVDLMIGSAANCNTTCSYTVINECQSGDGCCPPSCDSTLDQDCSVTCGNGVVEAQETCDPASSCPTSCDDQNGCTLDLLVGSATHCNATCSHSVISACVAGDGCCPAGCSFATDNDCSASCGNGVVEAQETCDPANSCPASCDDQNSCTIDQLTGNAANCNATCSHTQISSCAAGDGCCPAGCSVSNDQDCAKSKDPPTKDPQSQGQPRLLEGGCAFAGDDRPLGAGALGLLLLGLAGTIGMARRRRNRG